MAAMTLERATRIAAALKPETRAFIGGAYVPARSGATFTSINPATSEPVAEVAHCMAEDVDLAARAARAAFDQGGWSRAAPERRKEVLLNLAALVRAHGEELAVLESIDSGKTITDCLHEIGTEVANFFQWYGELIDKSFGRVAPTGEDTLALILREPAGVVGLVLPWNFPLLMAAWKLAPALAAGCSCIVKPAEQTPLTAIRLAALAAEAGVPPGVLNVVPGLGETTGQAVGRHPDIDVVSFTGSTEVGGLFLRYAGESNMKAVGLEMGGKSPFIVLEDAVLDDELIEHAAMSAFWNGGQNCSANMRQLVHRDLAEEYAQRIVARAARFVPGDPLDPATTLPAMVTAEHQERVMAHIGRGQAEGARLLCGGRRARAPGSFIEPAVFAGLAPGMAIAREEIFGPVLGILPIDGLDHAIAVARDTDYGLHASVFTRDIDRALRLARAIPAGTISVNAFSEGDVKMPFGGYRRSGSLTRDNGVEAMEQYLQTKTVWIALR